MVHCRLLPTTPPYLIPPQQKTHKTQVRFSTRMHNQLTVTIIIPIIIPICNHLKNCPTISIFPIGFTTLKPPSDVASTYRKPHAEDFPTCLRACRRGGYAGYAWGFLKMVDPEVTMGFNANSWSLTWMIWSSWYLHDLGNLLLGIWMNLVVPWKA